MLGLLDEHIWGPGVRILEVWNPCLLLTIRDSDRRVLKGGVNNFCIWSNVRRNVFFFRRRLSYRLSLGRVLHSNTLTHRHVTVSIRDFVFLFRYVYLLFRRIASLYHQVSWRFLFHFLLSWSRLIDTHLRGFWLHISRRIFQTVSGGAFDALECASTASFLRAFFRVFISRRVPVKHLIGYWRD